MQKGNVLIFLLVGIVVLAAIGGAFYLGRSTTPQPSPTPAAASQTPQSTSSQNERNFCSNKLKFCIQVPTGWQAEETLNPQGGSEYIVMIKDQDDDNNGISIWKAAGNNSSVKQLADSHLKNLIPEITQGTIRKSLPSISGQTELLIFPSPSPDSRTVAYYYGDLFIQPDLNSDIFRLNAGAAPGSGQLVGDTLVEIGSSLKVTK